MILALTASPASAQVKITEFFSNIEGCDVTVQSPNEARNLMLSFELQYKGKLTDVQESKVITVDSRMLEIDALEASKYYTYFITWNVSKEDGLYIAKVELKSKNSEVIDSTSYNFTYGHGALPRLTVADILADSKGVNVLVRPFEPVMADVDFHLIDAGRSIYSLKERNLAFTQAISLDKNWKTILENNREYAAIVKLHLYKPEQFTIAYTRYFTARDSAAITDVYADRSGVSATIEGKSQVPLHGKVEFAVIKDGVTVESTFKPSPSLMLDEEKTIEAIWIQQLSAGKYDVKVKLIGNDGDVLDLYDKVIEVEPIISKPTPAPTKQSPAIELPLVLLAIFAGCLIVRGRWGG